MNQFSMLFVTYSGLTRRIERVDLVPVNDEETPGDRDDPDDPRINNLMARDFVGMCRTEEADEIGRFVGEKYGMFYAGLAPTTAPQAQTEASASVGAASS